MFSEINVYKAIKTSFLVGFEKYFTNKTFSAQQENNVNHIENYLISPGKI